MKTEPFTIYRNVCFLDPKTGSDCKFLVGEKDAQELIPAHKAILASKSPVFLTMFYGSVPENCDIVNVPDIHPEIFHQMLEFVYYIKKTTIVSIDQAIKLWYIADKYCIQELLELTTDYLTKHITPQNVCYMLQLSIKHRNKIVLKKCQEIILKEVSVLLNDKSFLDPDLQLNLDKNMANMPEIKLFEALVRYNTELNNDGSEAVDPASPLQLVSADPEVKEASVDDRNPTDSSGEGQESSDQEDTGTQEHTGTNSIGDNQLKELVKKTRVLLISTFISLISDDVADM